MLDRDYLVEQAKEFEKITNSMEGFIAYDTDYETPVVKLTTKAIREMFDEADIYEKSEYLQNKYIVDYEGVRFIAVEPLW
jgi:hypothetical protein